jgi:hypothetical protein
LVDLYPINIEDEDSINAILYQADSILQYYDNQEPKDEYYPQDVEMQGENVDGDNNDDFN